MKRLLLVAALLIFFVSNQARAEQQGSLGGLILGAGSGALLGQAIGRNTESTVIGTAVGSAIGYMIGSEMDRNDRVYQPVNEYRPAPPRPVVKKHIIEHRYIQEPREYKRISYPRCKKAEMLGTVHGRPEMISGTVCKTPRGWELVSTDPTSRNGKWDRHNWKRNNHDSGHHGWRGQRHPRFVEHRF